MRLIGEQLSIVKLIQNKPIVQFKPEARINFQDKERVNLAHTSCSEAAYGLFSVTTLIKLPFVRMHCLNYIVDIIELWSNF